MLALASGPRNGHRLCGPIFRRDVADDGNVTSRRPAKCVVVPDRVIQPTLVDGISERLETCWNGVPFCRCQDVTHISESHACRFVK